MEIPRLQKATPMTAFLKAAPFFFRRVIVHEAARKGFASVAAGLLVATVCEAVWPSS